MQSALFTLVRSRQFGALACRFSENISEINGLVTCPIPVTFLVGSVWQSRKT